MKRILSFLLLFISMHIEAFESNGIFYSVSNDNNSVWVTSKYQNFGGTSEYKGDMVIPESIEYNGVTYTVIGIFNAAFCNCRELTSVTIPNSVTYIGWRAFMNCYALTSITIPGGVKTIEASAFENCKNLISVNIENGVEIIENNVFYNCEKLTSISIPQTIKCIATNVFHGCEALSSISIPDNITTIEANTFENCKSLTSISVPNIKVFSANSFAGCTALESISFSDSVLAIGASAFTGCTNLKSVEIPQSVISFGDGAFRDCTSLKSATVNNKFIGKGAFANCSCMKSIEIGKNVKHIGNNAFYGCDSLNSIVIPDNVSSIGNCAFAYCKNLSSVIIGKGIVSCGEKIFLGCDSLQRLEIHCKKVRQFWFDIPYINELVFGDGVSEICSKAFYNWYDAELMWHDIISVNIGNSVTSIGSNAFRQCNKLEELTIGNNVTYIGENAFEGCKRLKTLTIGNSIGGIGRNAFENSYSLSSFELLNPTPPSYYGSTFSSYYNAVLRVPFKAYSSYSSTNLWNKFKYKELIPDSSLYYTVLYMIDDDIYKTYNLREGEKINYEEEPTKEGFVFSGWGKVPDLMPAQNLTIKGTFTRIGNIQEEGEWVMITDDFDKSIPFTKIRVLNKGISSGYGDALIFSPQNTINENLHYAIRFCSLKIFDNTLNIDPEEGIRIVDCYPVGNNWYEYEFSRPVYFINYNGNYCKEQTKALINESTNQELGKHLIAYYVDGEVYKTYTLNEGDAITPEAEPTKDGYTFSGWSEIPSVMPNHNVNVHGTFIKNEDSVGIDECVMTYDDFDKPIYNLQGQRVTNPQNGIYIVNGKKVFIK